MFMRASVDRFHRQPQLSKLFAGVEERVAIRRGQDAVNR